MKIKIKDYMANYAAFKHQMEKRTPERRLEYIAEYSATSFVPIVVAYRFLTMTYGPNDEIEARIQSILSSNFNTLEE